MYFDEFETLNTCTAFFVPVTLTMLHIDSLNEKRCCNVKIYSFAFFATGISHHEAFFTSKRDTSNHIVNLTL